MPLDPARVQSLFFQAAQVLDANDRAALLDREAALEPELRQRVEALLGAHDKPDSFLDQPVSPAIAEILAADPGRSNERQESTGSPSQTANTVPTHMIQPAPAIRIGGRYQLLEMIGEGGMGEVWVAEQREPVRRRVAVKLIKAGMDSKRVLARFEAERQALAMMDHPNIARVFDGGTTDQGYPFFVMELVKGIPLLRYCDEHKLQIPDRLSLFVQICQAVQHAHQKGIIHRDLKPGNILVTEMDSQPVPKVIDFGLAKALQGVEALTEHTLYTVFGGVAGTPLYMAPEQASINTLDVDTRTDIYALGVILYELLTGTTPLESNRLKQAQWEEIRRLISEEDVPRPSARLSSSDVLPTIAASRQIEPARLQKLVCGDLDWIVLKALEKDRSRRYQTANALARDIERFMSDEPVEACPPSAAYRFRKFARRNARTLFAGAALLSMLVLLVIALGISNVRVARERNQKAEALQLAQIERQRAESNFVKARRAIASLIAQPATGMNEWSQFPPALRKKFAEEAARYYQNLLAEDSANHTLRYETAVGFRSLGYLDYRLKDYQDAEKHLRESIAILDPLTTEYPDHPEYRQQAGWSRLMLAYTLVDTSRPQEAQHTLERAAEIYEALIAQNPRNVEYPDELRWCYQQLLALELPPEGIDEPEMRRRADALLARIPPQTLAAPIVHGRLGEFYARQGRWKDAIAQFEQGIRLFQQQTPQARLKQSLAPLLLEYQLCLADVLIDSGRSPGPGEAIQLLERAAAERPADATLLRGLGLTHARLGQWSEAATALGRSVEAKPTDAQSWYALATLRLMAGDVQGYRQTCREMFKRFGDTREPKSAGRIALTCSLAPDAVDDTAGLLRLADHAPANEEQYTAARGMAEYRAGRYGMAIQSLHPQDGRVKPWDMIGFAALSMAHQRLGHMREAAAALASASSLNQKIGGDPAQGQPLPSDLILHLIQARILLREAEQLIQVPTTAPAPQTSLR